MRSLLVSWGSCKYSSSYNTTQDRPTYRNFNAQNNSLHGSVNGDMTHRKLQRNQETIKILRCTICMELLNKTFSEFRVTNVGDRVSSHAETSILVSEYNMPMCYTLRSENVCCQTCFRTVTGLFTDWFWSVRGTLLSDCYTDNWDYTGCPEK